MSQSNKEYNKSGGFSSALLILKNMQTIQEFLERHVDGYLIHDLRRMSDIKEFENGHGACGYPMLMAILSGIELIGILNSPKKITEDLFHHNSESFFKEGWNKLFIDNTQYSREPTREIFRKLLRNGLAHMYLSKPNIGVTKSDSEAHLQSEDGMFFVHPIIFFKDFEDAYEKIKQSMLDSEECQSRLNEIMYIMTLESRKLINDYSAVTKPIYAIGTPMSATPATDIGSCKTFKKLLEKLED